MAVPNEAWGCVMSGKAGESRERAGAGMQTGRSHPGALVTESAWFGAAPHTRALLHPGEVPGGHLEGR